MREKMKLLIALQNCDNRIRDAEKKKDQCPIKMASLDEEVNKAELALGQAKEKLEAIKKERRQVERDIDDLEVKKKKSQAKLSTVSSNKEYRAALKEIEELDRAKGLLEDKALELMDQVEQFEQEIKLSTKELEALKKKTDEEKRTIKGEMGELDALLSTLIQERDEICRQIDRDLLSRYDMLRERRGGVAVSPVISGVCQTCHMGIPPQKFNELIRGDVLMSCPNCQRIIYWGEDEKLKAANESGEKES
ncbi:MAG: hypothetical protein DRH15_08530 [Deltaproteobacteria bacterium]|nr:MAG: hypothetical protein DRH15_08530 [Deltaproteobacteria bacterium]